MKKLFIAMLIVLSCNTNAFCLDDNTTMDVVSHIGGGAIISGLTTYYLPDDMNPYLKWTIGALAGTLAGAVKEGVIDDIWDDTDFFQWTLGGAIGATFIVITF